MTVEVIRILVPPGFSKPRVPASYLSFADYWELHGEEQLAKICRLLVENKCKRFQPPTFKRATPYYNIECTECTNRIRDMVLYINDTDEIEKTMFSIVSIRVFRLRLNSQYYNLHVGQCKTCKTVYILEN